MAKRLRVEKKDRIPQFIEMQRLLTELPEMNMTQLFKQSQTVLPVRLQSDKPSGTVVKNTYNLFREWKNDPAAYESKYGSPQLPQPSQAPKVTRPYYKKKFVNRAQHCKGLADEARALLDVGRAENDPVLIALAANVLGLIIEAL